MHEPGGRLAANPNPNPSPSPSPSPNPNPNPNQVASRLSAAGYVPATRLSLEQRYSVEEGGGAEGPAWSREGRVVTLEGGGKACRL